MYAPKCVIDRQVLNNQSISDMVNIGLSFFAPLCGRNRGVFVVNPPDGNTYSCSKFPDNIFDLAGIKEKDVQIEGANDIVDQFHKNHITGEETLELLDFFTQTVYNSSAYVDQNPFACDVGGLSTLVNCKNSDDGRTNFLAKLDGEPIRSVTLAGSFVPAPQITGGKELTLDEIDAFYTYADFNEMKSYGLNSVQIQLPVDSSLYPKNATFKMIENALNTMILRITDAKLKIILALERASVEHQDSLEDQIQTISSYAILASKKFSHDILALVLPKDFENLIPQIRNIATSCLKW